MLILSIVPIHLSKDSNNIPVNATSDVDVAEHRVMELEALLSSLILRQYFGEDVSGVSNSDAALVSQELEKERANDLGLMSLEHNIDSNDSLARLEEIQRMQGWTNQRINDLEALSDAVSKGTTLNYHVTGVVNDDPNVISTELNRAIAYKDMLKSSSDFWNQTLITQANPQTPNTETHQAQDNPEQKPAAIEIPTTAEENDNTGQEELLDNSTLLALSKRRISELSALLNFSQSVDSLISKEKDIKEELYKELSKTIRTLGNDGLSLEKVSNLKSSLKDLTDQKSAAELGRVLQDSVVDEIVKEINNSRRFL